MNQNLEKPVTDFSFFIAPDKNLVMRCPTGFAPVAAFTTVLRVDDSVVHASFALDDNGNLQHSNFPFETLSVSIRHQRVYINGLHALSQSGETMAWTQEVSAPKESLQL